MTLLPPLQVHTAWQLSRGLLQTWEPCQAPPPTLLPAPPLATPAHTPLPSCSNTPCTCAGRLQGAPSERFAAPASPCTAHCCGQRGMFAGAVRLNGTQPGGLFETPTCAHVRAAQHMSLDCLPCCCVWPNKAPGCSAGRNSPGAAGSDTRAAPLGETRHVQQQVEVAGEQQGAGRAWSQRPTCMVTLGNDGALAGNSATVLSRRRSLKCVPAYHSGAHQPS